MPRKIIYLLCNKTLNRSSNWQPVETFEDKIEADMAQVRETERNPDFLFRVTQIPFTPR